MMVLAGPGSGKTAVVTERAHRLCSSVINPADILVISYSRASALEMRSRFVSRFAQDVPKVVFGTFHSLFFKIVRRGAYAALPGLPAPENLQVLQDGMRTSVVRGILRNMGHTGDDDFVHGVLMDMSLMRSDMVHPQQFVRPSVAPAEFEQLLREYETYKRDCGKIDFDDMLTLAHQVLSASPAHLKYWRRKFSYIMVDEFQDINQVQYKIVQMLAAPKNNLFVVGDDDQSIYSFRGSRPEILLDFPADYPNARQVLLSTNYRCSNAIIDYANRMIAHNKTRYAKDIQGIGRGGPAPVVLYAKDNTYEAAQIAQMVRRQVLRGRAPGDFAVLYRLNAQARVIADAFFDLNIPFASRDQVSSIHNHWIAGDLRSYMQAARHLAAGKREFCTHAAQIISKPARGINHAFLADALKRNVHIFDAYPTSLLLGIAAKAHIEALQRGLLRLAKMNAADAIRYICFTLGFNTHIIYVCNQRQILRSGTEEILSELLQSAQTLGSQADFVAAGRRGSDAYAQSIEAHTDRVTLSTLHSAKGLEFSQVFIAGAVEDILPHARSQDPAAIEQERRLFYVGCTRAKDALYISVIKKRYEKKMHPSRFLV